MPSWWEALVMGLATFRIANIVANEHGPGEAFDKLRLWAGEHEDKGVRTASTAIGRGLICSWCVSVWVGFFFFGLYSLRSLKAFRRLWWWLTMPFSFSSIALIVDRWVNNG